MSLTDTTHPSDIALNTDLYELTMAQAFYEAGKVDTRACFNVFFRENPFKGGYAIACGTGQIGELVKNFHFSDEALSYLSSLEAPQGGALFTREFLGFLKDLELDVDIYAVPEGDLIFPREPLVRVEGPIIQCQLLETALLNLVNFQTLVATKTARVVQAAQGRPVSDFGLRRAQGPDGGLTVARASYIGGASSTSNVLAGKIFGIPVFGTHAHSWVMSFPTELEAFRSFAASSPKNCTLLVDTYDVAQGIENAIVVGKEMERAGERLAAVRIDSGDLAKLSKMCRKRLDEEGLDYVKISASNDLDEYTIQSLFVQEAPLDAFGVGTKLATCDPQPSLGGVYKLSAFQDAIHATWQPVMKLSEQAFKRTIPGVQQILRFKNAQGQLQGDVIIDISEKGGLVDAAHLQDIVAAAQTEGIDAVDVMDADKTYHFCAPHVSWVLKPFVQGGEPTADADASLERAKEHTRESLTYLDAVYRRFLNPEIYPVALSQSLAKTRSALAREERANSGHPVSF